MQDEEIVFEDEVMIENNCSLNAYIPLYYIDIFKKFNIKEKEEIEYLDDDYLDFEIGKTTKEDIWHWFDDRYSEGVHMTKFMNP